MSGIRRKSFILVLAGLALATLGSGCARRVHHHHHAPAKSVVVLDNEHHDKTIVVVDVPKPKRKCWKHRGHFHCRVR